MEKNDQQKPLYTVGIWTIKSGQESAFINLWSSFAVWMNEHTTGVGKGLLLQDAQDASRFISIGPWDDAGSIAKWRESAEFKEFVGKAVPLSDGFQPGTLNVVATA